MKRPDETDRAVAIGDGIAVGENIVAAEGIAAAIRRHARSRPHAPAIVAPGEPPISYAALHEWLGHATHALRHAGVEATSRVAVRMPAGRDAALATLATMCSAICIPVDPEAGDDDLEFRLRDTGASFVLCDVDDDRPLPSSKLRRLTMRNERSGSGTLVPVVAIPVETGDPAAIAFPAALHPAHPPRTNDVDATCLLLHTSGTTATPKLVPLSQRNVLASALANARCFGLGPRDRCLNVLPLLHIGGLVHGMLSTLVSGGSLVCARGFDPESFFPLVAEFAPTWYTGTPTIHAALLPFLDEYRRLAPAHRFRFLRSASAPLPTERIERLERAFGAPLIEAYGMTEAGRITCNPIGAGRRKPGSVGVPAGLEVRIVGADGTSLRHGEIGEIAVRGASVTAGYLDDDEANAASFHDGWFRTGDLGHFDADGYLFLTGRLKELINRGGKKIAPREVDEALMALRGVREAAAFAVPHPTLGEDLVAAVVADAGFSVDSQVLRRELLVRLARHKVPSAIHVVDVLPRGTTGKIQRSRLAERFAGAAAPRRETAQTGTESTIARIVASVLGLEDVGSHDNFFLIGGDSLSAARAAARVVAEFGLTAAPGSGLLFEFPTVATLAAEIERLRRAGKIDPSAGVRADPSAAAGSDASERRRRLLALRLAATRTGASSTRAAAAADPTAGPLSFAQQALWLIDRLQGPGSSYNVSLASRFTGSLDVRALERALQTFVDRHAALRTRFDETDGAPTQIVEPRIEVTLPVVALERGEAQSVEDPVGGAVGAANDAIDDAIDNTVRAFIAQPFDLASAPVWRARMLRVGEDDHVFVFVVHHIVADATSIALLARELPLLYEGVRSGAAAQKSGERRASFLRYATRQRQTLSDNTTEASMAYWRTQLAGLEPIALPTDRPRKRTGPQHGGRVTAVIDAQHVDALRTIARTAGATLHMALLAAFGALLMRYTGQHDFAIGTPVAGRGHGEYDDVFGMFVNMLAMRADGHGDPDFVSLLGRVRQTASDAYSHQEIPFDRIVAELAGEREPGRNPVFQVSFGMQDARSGELVLPGVDSRSIRAVGETSKFDLSLACLETGGSIHANFTYSTDLFYRETIERLAASFGTLVAGIVEQPNAKLSTMPLMDEQERERLLVRWNGPVRDYPLHKTLHLLFEEQAARTPGATAVIFEGRELDYATLEAQANRLAHHLRTLGVGPDVLVAVCMQRSLELVVALVGILKAGGAWVPVDPDYPADRIEYMLGDSAAPVVLTQDALLGRVRDAVGARGAAAVRENAAHACVIALDSPEWLAHSAKLSDAPPHPLAGPDDLAYVVYTSGSTGKPKGAMVPHRGIVNRVLWKIDYVGLTAADRLFQKTSISFDASVWKFFAPLAVGAPVVLARPGGEKDTAYHVEAIRTLGVTITNAVPSELRALLFEPSFAACTTLRHFVTGGEVVDWGLLDEFHRQLPHTQLAVYYGPTECSDVTTSIDTAELVEEPGPVPIGRPIANARVYILDATLQPVPVGVTGELYIGGAGLARGYLNRPEFTAERFVPDPFVPGERMYRSGDLVRWRPRGIIGFVGRTDHQVKIRGLRVEPGEIEATMNGCDGVRQSVVVVREDRPGDRRLVAYVEGESIDAEALRRSLAARLPEYMVPAAIVPLAAIPRLPNNKLDRNRLPEPADGGDNDAQLCVAPRTPVEQTLATIWAEVLGRSRVGVHENFFVLGGHSLLATQAMARVRRALRAELPLRMLFEAPTVAGFARALEAGAPAPATRTPVPATEANAAPLSPAQEALWFIEKLNGPGSRYNVTDAVRLRGELHVDALRDALRALLRRHDALRTAFREARGIPEQFVVDDDEPDFEVIHAAPHGGADDPYPNTPLLHVAANEPFDLAAGRPFRVRLLRRSSTDHVLLVAAHHIVFDGWSAGVLARELPTLYEAAISGADPRDVLPPVPIRFLDYAIWSRRRLDEADLRRQLAFWVARLGGVASHELPLDSPRTSKASLGAGTHTIAIARESAEALAALAHRSGATQYMVLLAAFRVLLARYGAGDDIAIGTPIAGRAGAELDGVIGYFVNMLAMRSDAGGDPRFGELLARVRRDTLDAYSNQDVPFDRIVVELNPPRDAGRNPIFQITFALQGAWETAPALPGMRHERVRLQASEAKFDLSLTMADTGDGLVARFDYDRGLFGQATIERLAGHLRNVLDGIVADPHARLSELPLLEAGELQQMLVRWNDTAREFPQHETLQALFEQHARRAPRAPAVVFEGRTCLDYGDLNRRANRLARRLRALGIGPDVPVGISLPRVPELVVAMLAVIKAGGAYLPIDPDYPAERIAFMLTDSRAPVTITHRALRERLGGTDTQALCIDGDAAMADVADLDDGALDPEPRALPGSLAYIVYTSGSTGRPKGVMVSHRAVARLVRNTDYVRIGAADCIAQASNVSFDAATFEIWGALLNGARLAMLSTDTLLSTQALQRRIAEDRISTMFVTTAVFNEHAARAPDTFRGLRELLFGGEAVHPGAVVRVLRGGPPQRLLHVYGPTETTTFATWHEVPRSLARGDTPGTVPIGVPIANTHCHVLDAAMQPVPIGVVGDLWIGGPGLARGYLNRPELDAHRFVDAAPPIGERLYRTGDRVRRLADGSLVFVGRSDDQVKLRGFRIELGEVRAALAAVPGIAQHEVLVREDTPGERRLVAYVVGSGDSPPPDVGRLRAVLGKRLPAFMIPTAFVALDTLPTTHNGKIDRAALPAPSSVDGRGVDGRGVDGRGVDDRGADGCDEGSVDTGDALERELRAIWESVLGIDAIPLDADFFDLGGHSMLAVRVLAEIDRRMGRQLRTASFFEAPTIRRFAALLRGQSGSNGDGCVVTVQPGDGERPLFFVSGWGGQLIVLNELARALGPQQPLHVLDTGAFVDDGSGFTLEEIVSRMIGDMRRIQPHGPYRLAGYSMGGKFVHEIAQQLRASGEPVALLALLDCAVPGSIRRRSAPVRVLLHLRKAVRMKPAQTLVYLAGRARWMVRHMLPRERRLFEGDDIEETALTRAMQRSARAMLDAWSAYRPRDYAGSILLIRAEGTPERVGQIRDDPTYGWAAITAGGVTVRSMDCAHNRMLTASNADALARILNEAIGGHRIVPLAHRGKPSAPAPRGRCDDADSRLPEESTAR